MRWKNPTGGTFDAARFEPEWESDLLYKGALGAVLALDEELRGGAIGVVKELARVLPEEHDVLPSSRSSSDALCTRSAGSHRRLGERCARASPPARGQGSFLR
jgi:hypothetical protein